MHRDHLSDVHLINHHGPADPGCLSPPSGLFTRRPAPAAPSRPRIPSQRREPDHTGHPRRRPAYSAMSVERHLEQVTHIAETLESSHEGAQETYK